jgi:pSer/pThr/pTyr-binding forkhead associated (FHA) protein/outer membrane biosynthesis protein TonB
VEIQNTKKEKLFQILLEDKSLPIKGNVLSYGRKLIGRSESCDIVIPHSTVSAVHAVLEVSPRGIKLFDMNSKNGSSVNGKKVVTTSISEGDQITLGSISFTFSVYEKSSSLPPVLDTLEPSQGKSSILPPVAPVMTESEEAPYIVYPLASDPKADYSEYIFEDVDELVPIFKYEHGKQAVEVIILFNDQVYSVDYLPEEDGVYSIVGSKPKKKEFEFAYLGKDEKIDFIEVKSGNCVIHKLHNYEIQHLSNDEILETKDLRINIQNDDVVKLENGHLDIYVRRVFSPPKVKAAPLFRRDRELKKYILICLLFLFIPLTGLLLLDVEKKEEEKDPDRIARILYKRIVKKLPKIKKVIKKKPKKQSDKKSASKRKPVNKPAEKSPKKNIKKVVKKPGVKTAKKVVTQKKVKKPAPKAAASKAPKVANKSAAKSKSTNKQARRARRPSPKVGRVDAYKSFDFKSTISSSMAKGGALKGAKVAKASSNTSLGGASIGGGVATNLKKADSGTAVGNLTGSTVGKLAQSKGTEGLSAKSGVYTAGIPSETVVLGSMDPDVIRRILREHIPQFRYCYQKELDRNANKNLSGTVELIFTIGASGTVSKAGVASKSSLPGPVRGCVTRVLRGIRFPRPLGGGTVDVKQPFNFKPQNI